jgi:hypothetical protein
MVTRITFNAVRVLVLLGGLSLLFALAVLALSVLTLPAARPTAAGRRVYRWMNLYFLGIGFGYICVQLSLHQTFILHLGHPTFALSVLLCSMLLGTGLGAALSRRLFAGGRRLRAWGTILVGLILLLVASPAASALSTVSSTAARAAVAGAVSLAVGLILGFAFPIGVRLVAPTGERAVQKMWAVNGAASIAGAALAAIIGVTLGSGAVLALGIACYVVATAAGLLAARAGRPS